MNKNKMKSTSTTVLRLDSSELEAVREALAAFRAWQAVEIDDPRFDQTVRRWEAAKSKAAFVVMAQIEDLDYQGGGLAKQAACSLRVC